jgi:opacity protein-like surface antigen
MRHYKKTALMAGFIILGLLCSAQMPRQVRVLIDNANIRTRPELDAEVMDVAAKGTLFDVIEKAGPWYTIRMGEDGTGKTVTGYIHESMVELSGDASPKPQNRLEPPPAPPPPPPAVVEEPAAPAQEPIGGQSETRSRDKLISGAFLKYGFGDHWLASFGFDLGLGRHFGLGLEFQPYFSNISAIDLSVIQMDIFLNLKLGFQLWFFTLYGGGGVGPDLSYATSEIEGESFSKFKSMLAYHGVAGVAVNLGRIAVVFEYQPVMVSDPDLDPDSWGHYFFIGLRF